MAQEIVPISAKNIDLGPKKWASAPEASVVVFLAPSMAAYLAEDKFELVDMLVPTPEVVCIVNLNSLVH